MTHFNPTIWTRTTKAFSVVLDWTYDDTSPADWMDDDDAKEAMDNINRGKWTMCLFRVRVLNSQGETIGADYLGGSLYADPDDFARERGGYLRDMVSEAIADARRAYSVPRGYLRAA